MSTTAQTQQQQALTDSPETDLAGIQSDFAQEDLRLVVASWNDIPDRVKAEIVAMVKPYTRTPDAAERRAAVQDALRKAHRENAD